MPNDIDWDDEDDNDESNDSGQVSESDLIRQLRKQVRKSGKRVVELETANKGLTQVQQERTVKEFLEKKGVNPKTARLILKDLDTVDESSIDTWLTENAEILTFTPKAVVSAEEQANLDALAAQDALTSQAGSPGTGAGDVATRLANAKTPAEFNEILASQQ